MSSSYLQGIQAAFDNQAEIVNDIYVVTSNWFVNRCPIVTRTPRVPVGSTTFSIVSRRFRPRTASLGAAVAATDAQITLVDASPFMNGDVLQLASGERVEIIADPNLANNTISVRRAAEGTTAGTGAANDTILLISNSRTGAEINQNGVALRPVGTAQFCQTWQHPVQVGGSLQASSAFQTSPGIRTPFEQSKMDALQNLMDDMESSTYYGRGEDPAVAARPKQKGLRTLLSVNNTTNPINAGAYKATDFLRDTLQAARSGGGDPDVLLLSTNFMLGLATWGQAVMRMNAGTNVFGTPKIPILQWLLSLALSRVPPDRNGLGAFSLLAWTWPRLLWGTPATPASLEDNQHESRPSQRAAESAERGLSGWQVLHGCPRHRRPAGLLVVPGLYRCRCGVLRPVHALMLRRAGQFPSRSRTYPTLTYHNT